MFFSTLASLLPQDPGLVDIYDARVNGGLPGPSTGAASCEGEACQTAPSPPNDSTPASTVFNGPGDQVAALMGSATPKQKTASQAKAEKLASSLRACRKP